MKNLFNWFRPFELVFILSFFFQIENFNVKSRLSIDRIILNSRKFLKKKLDSFTFFKTNFRSSILFGHKCVQINRKVLLRRKSVLNVQINFDLNNGHRLEQNHEFEIRFFFEFQNAFKCFRMERWIQFNQFTQKSNRMKRNHDLFANKREWWNIKMTYQRTEKFRSEKS